MRYTDQAPLTLVRPELRRFVCHVKTSRSELPAPSDALFTPRAEASILVRWSAHGDLALSVLGPLTRARHKSFAAPRRLIQVVLRAGQARALLGVPLSVLADQIVPVQELWGDRGRRLGDAIAASDPERALTVLQDELCHRLRASDAPASRPGLLTRAVGRLDAGADRIAPLASELGVSERHLRRLFMEELGMAPKLYARIARLRRVIEQPHDDDSWSELALASGYSDQSHMIYEFRALLQATPPAFFTRKRQALFWAAPTIQAPSGAREPIQNSTAGLAKPSRQRSA